MRRVVITGVGVVTPVGNDKETFFNSLIAGKSGISTITSFDAADYSSQIAGEVRNFDPSPLIKKKDKRHIDKFTQFALVAAGEALADAQLKIDETNSERVAVIVGSGIGGLMTLERQHEILLKHGPRRVNPYLVPMMISDMAAGQISIYFGARGPNWCPVSACATGTHAIGESFEIIKRGAADVAITGGSEAPVTPLGVAGFCAARALSKRNDEPTKASRPFDTMRDGFVIGEGAGILIIESLSSAESRGADIYAEIIGYGATADAYHVTSPDLTGSGAARSMKKAIEEADIDVSEVGYINAHGTSTKINDAMETLAIKDTFGKWATKILISSTKSMTGHLLGAAGGIELIASTLALNKKIFPPTINLDNPDSGCDLNYLPNKAVAADIRIAMSNSFGFGGHNAAIVIRKWLE